MTAFDKHTAYDHIISTLSAVDPTPSKVIKAQVEVLEYLQSIHDNSYAKGYEDCLDINIPIDDTSKS